MWLEKIDIAVVYRGGKGCVWLEKIDVIYLLLQLWVQSQTCRMCSAATVIVMHHES